MKKLRPSLRRLLDTVEYLVDDQIGIIRYVGEIPREVGAPAFFHFYAQASDTSAFTKQKNFGSAGGASVERGGAMAKAIGEAVERYSAAIYELEELPLASFESATFPCIPPSEFVLYGPEQYARSNFPYSPFLNSTSVRWTPAVDLVSGDTWHVPASMVFIPYTYDPQANEPAIAQPISTGLACHMSYAEAAISAICEVIERDAFTITWQARLARPQIRIETLSDRNRGLVERFERTGGVVSLLDLTMDHGVPTILSVLRSHALEAPALVFAASTDLNPELAVRKSLEELAHTRRLAQDFKTNLPRFVPSATFDNLVHQDDHVHLYCDPASAVLADFLFQSEQTTDFEMIENQSTGDPDLDLRILGDKVCSVGPRVLVADITTPDVGELGFVIVRAVIPGFHPLVMGHENRALGGSRLWEVPQKLGYRGITRGSGDNPAPHPYP